MSLLSRFLPARKSVPPLGGGGPLAFLLDGRPVWSSRDGAGLGRRAFERNAVAHRAVRLLAEAAASVPLTLTVDGRALDRHPVADLLERPNRREAGLDFLGRVYGQLLLVGNAYLQASSVDGVPRELFALRPDLVQVRTGPDGWPAGYDYAVGGRTLRLPAEAGEGGPGVLHLTLAHPLDDLSGLAPAAAAAAALDIHDAASAWTKALLDNAARPSGALVVGGRDAQPLADTSLARLRRELEDSYAGAANAGRPMLLEGGLDWKPLSFTPKDMDFVQSKNAAAREIALAFGVPPLLLGMDGDNTHANYAEANRAFYRQSVLPLARRTAASLAAWLGPAFGPDGERLRLEPDPDAIEALADERESLWRRVGGATFLTDDEKREAVGYGRA